MLLEPVQIIFETLVSGFAQSPGQAAVNHGVLAVVQADPSALVNEGLDPIEISVCPCEFSALKGISLGLCVMGPIHTVMHGGRQRWQLP